MVAEKRAQFASLSDIADAPTNNFVELIRLSGLDPSRHLRFADWSGVDFSACDLRGYDFTGARLYGCKFDGALIDGALFEQAEMNRSDLRSAADWGDYRKSWLRTSPSSFGDRPPTDEFQDLPNEFLAPEMVAVPAGRFWMGSKTDDRAAPLHEVRIPHSFEVGRCLVTFGEWDAAQGDKSWRRVTGKQPRRPADEGWGRDRRPVINVSWDDAQAYVEWLSKKSGQHFRLLSEAEWEYACRAGSQEDYCFGQYEKLINDYAWYNRNSKGKTHPVGEKKPNAFGLYDMHGNVWEWCEDDWNGDYNSKPEILKATGDAWTIGNRDSRVLRGGSWHNDAGCLCSSFRINHYSVFRGNIYGFRIARTLGP